MNQPQVQHQRVPDRRSAPQVFLGLLFLWLLLVLPATSQAHALIPGTGEFSRGLLHPLVTPAHVLLLLAMGLWIGQHPPLRLRVPTLLFMAFSAAGLLVTTQVSFPASGYLLLIAIALLLALCVLALVRIPVWAGWLIIAVAAFAVGLDSGADRGPMLAAVVTTYAGSWITLTLCFLNFSFYTALCPQWKWVQIGIRVAASWIAAICLLLLAFALQGPAFT